MHYTDIIMGAIASQITSLTTVYSTLYTDADQRRHQSSASLAFLRGIHPGPVNSPHKWPVMRKMFPFDDVIMCGFWIVKIDTVVSEIHFVQDLGPFWVYCCGTRIKQASADLRSFELWKRTYILDMILAFCIWLLNHENHPTSLWDTFRTIFWAFLSPFWPLVAGG